MRVQVPPSLLIERNGVVMILTVGCCLWTPLGRDYRTRGHHMWLVDTEAEIRYDFWSRRIWDAPGYDGLFVCPYCQRDGWVICTRTEAEGMVYIEDALQRQRDRVRVERYLEIRAQERFLRIVCVNDCIVG